MSTAPPAKTIGLATWFRSFPLAVRLLGAGAVRRRHGRLGRALTMSDGRAYVAFRETVLDPARWGGGGPPAVLQARFTLPLMPGRARVRHALFRRVCIVTTPFFVGLPGYRSKLWMVDPPSGDFAGLYEWDSASQALAYGRGLVRVLRLLSVPGSVSYEVTRDCTVARYLDGARRRAA